MALFERELIASPSSLPLPTFNNPQNPNIQAWSILSSFSLPHSSLYRLSPSPLGIVRRRTVRAHGLLLVVSQVGRLLLLLPWTPETCTPGSKSDSSCFRTGRSRDLRSHHDRCWNGNVSRSKRRRREEERSNESVQADLESFLPLFKGTTLFPSTSEANHSQFK